MVLVSCKGKIAIGCTMICLISCSAENSSETLKDSNIFFSRNFISQYYEIGRMDVFSYSDDPNIDTTAFQIQFSASKIYSRNENESIFESLCDKFKDHGFNRYLTDENMGSINDIVDINITSSADFPDHKAGTSLNDIVILTTYSAKKFIDSNYSEPPLIIDSETNPIMYNGTIVVPAGDGYLSTRKLASEIQPEDLILMPLRLNLTFLSKPINMGEQVLTISFKQVDDETLTCQYGFDFYKDYKEKN